MIITISDLHTYEVVTTVELHIRDGLRSANENPLAVDALELLRGQRASPLSVYIQLMTPTQIFLNHQVNGQLALVNPLILHLMLRLLIALHDLIVLFMLKVSFLRAQRNRHAP